jgi:hypothetical protein
MRLIDLTRTLDPTDLDRLPEVVRPLAAVLAPKIQYLAPDAEGRDREVFIVQQLTNLNALPATGFKVGFFPIKIARASAAPARVVAFVE